MANGTFQALDFQDAIINLFTGNIGGCIGETSAIAILIGAVILLYKHIIGFTIPVSFIGTVFRFSGCLMEADSYLLPVLS
jgi:electron transport complex protein RnfD